MKFGTKLQTSPPNLMDGQKIRKFENEVAILKIEKLCYLIKLFSRF